MKLKTVKEIIMLVLVVIIGFTACEEKPTQIVLNNPFDVENPETGGDPFQLTAQIANGGITLSWNKPVHKDLRSFKIYRSEHETAGYDVLDTVGQNSINYIDRTVENGHSYWYVVTVVNNTQEETARTNITAINIKTEPLLLINNGAEYSPSRDVSLNILAAGAEKMIISNSNDFSDSDWETYVLEKNWLLPVGIGPKAVFLKVKYDDGNESDVINKNIILDTIPPILILTVSPDSGITNETTFTFDPTGSSDNYMESNKLKIRFDWNNDGVFITDWQNASIVNHHIEVGGGDVTIRMQLRDGAGWTVETTKNIFVNTRPIAGFTATEYDTNLNRYFFDASASFDEEDGKNIHCRWDFDGDNAWDTGLLTFSDTISHTYNIPGEYFPRLLVIDQNHLSSEIEMAIDVVGNTFTDIDGNIYNIVKIGSQYWMKENLKVFHYRNGDIIPVVSDDDDWVDLSSGACCVYNNDMELLETYGLLYNWYVVNDSRNIAPEGWHVSTDEDWKQMEMFLGMSQEEANGWGWRGTDEGMKLKSINGWLYDYAGTNESGFTGLPGGGRVPTTGNYESDGAYGKWWYSMENGNPVNGARSLVPQSCIDRSYFPVRSGKSIRCVKD